MNNRQPFRMKQLKTIPIRMLNLPSYTYSLYYRVAGIHVIIDNVSCI